MRTPNQTRASRANGAKSKGPVTPQGKHNSSRNRTRHGMFADTIVLEAEDKSQFLEMLEDLFAEYQPRTRMESMLVEVLAAARWRQDRIFGMQKVAFDYDVSTSPATGEIRPLRAVLAMRTPESARSHELLLRYEVALDRQVSRTLLRLERLQARELPESEKSAKGAVRTVPAEEPIAPHSVLRGSRKSAKGAARTVPAEEPIAPPSVLRGSRNDESAPEERTQQPPETTAPPPVTKLPSSVGRAPGLQPDPRPASAPPVSSPKVPPTPTRLSKGAKKQLSKQHHPEKRPA